MITWLYPEALLLFIPAISLWWYLTGPNQATPKSRWDLLGRLKAPRGVLHLVILTIGILALASPAWLSSQKGSDLILLIDRSASMDQEDSRRVIELIELAENARQTNDRLGIVTFGRKSALEQRPRERQKFSDFTKEVDDQGSNLEAGLTTALRTIRPDRRARILVFSDGEYTGLNPESTAWQAASRSIGIDYRHFPRQERGDVAVGRIELPRQVHRGEGFQFSAQLLATDATTCQYELKRQDTVISKGEVNLRPGENILTFRDRPWQAGVGIYKLKISSPTDQKPQNDYGVGVTQIEGSSPILLLSAEGTEGNLARALKSAGHKVDVVESKNAHLTMPDLISRPLVILENVPATDFSISELRTLSRYVESAGGGLLMTGGRRSFGIGGYYRSPLEDTLPVSLELRKEARKLRLAIAFVLDRSGSMGMPAGAGTKMDLANQGCIAAGELLTAIDEASVTAVDSAPHRVFPLAQLGDKAKFNRDVGGITAGGGGIYTYTGLAAGAKELAESSAGTRHIVLFADAADAEEPGEYIELLTKLDEAGVTVSVIALGSETDSDAEFLKDVARRGNGEVYFTMDAEELPQLFGMETINISRAAFSDVVTKVTSHGALAEIGESTWSEFPDIGGYNLTYAKPRAMVGLSTVDEFKAPLFAAWQRGLGRCAVYTGEIDGVFSGDLAKWKDFDAFFATVSNWLASAEAPDELSGRVERFDDTVKVTLEFDPEDPESRTNEPSVLHVIPADSDRAVQEIPMDWSGPHTMTASYQLTNDAIQFHRVTSGAKLTKLGGATLPYNPEFASRVGRPDGRSTLKLLAQRTGGHERSVMDKSLFNTKENRQQLRSMSLPLVILFLILIVGEIAIRRLGIGKFQIRSKKRILKEAGASSTSATTSPAVVISEEASSKAAEAAKEAKKAPTLAVLKEAKRRSR